MKRAALSFDTVKARKAPQEAPGADLAPSGGSDTPKAAEGVPAPSLSPRGRGRPPKRTDEPTYGLTVRIGHDLWAQLRQLATDETKRRGRIISLNELMLEAVAELIKRRARP
ncbi:MAG: hypothetical protein IM644_14010 [Phenylobacterium sp.]|uniref:hypothetical protein n=1 Tax=Phenylobacterium sp. TaxID=1871053 RepID=UPI0025D19189|nr:hypothetical protein [Phenylobacterium sp.]MCA6233369.1 hypothetical protein [Phenylobacterium sp.]